MYATIFKKKLTINEFLNRVTFPENSILTGLANFDVPRGYISNCEDVEDDDDSNSSQSLSQTTSQNDNDTLCIICTDNRSNTLLLPCRHLKTCNECYLSLIAKHIADNEDNTCPVCRSIIEDSMIVFI